MSPHEELDPDGPEAWSDLDAKPHPRIDTLETVLSRPPAWRRHLVLSGVVLLAGVIVLVSIWRGLVPVVQRALVAPLTPVPLTPTPTLAVAGRVSATIPLGAVHDHTFIAASVTAVWVHDGPSGTLTRIDPTTNTVVARLALGGQSHDVGAIAVDSQAVWVADASTGIVSRIDPERNQVTTSIKLAPGATLLTVSPGSVWVVNFPKHTVTKIDEPTNRVVASLSIPSLPIGITFGAGSVWICDRQDGAAGVIRLDPQTNQIQAQIDVREGRGLWCNGDLQVTSQGVWVPIFDTLTTLRQHLLERIDPATNKVTDLIGLGGDMNTSIAADAHGVWVCDPTSGLSRVDPQTKRVVAKVPLPGGDSLALSAGALWLTRTSDNSVVRISPSP
jgi:DNA-binding beta-propeller fold protein YncE